MMGIKLIHVSKRSPRTTLTHFIINPQMIKEVVPVMDGVIKNRLKTVRTEMDGIHLVEFIQVYRGLRAVCHTHITWSYDTYEELGLLLVHYCFCCGSPPVNLYVFFMVTALARGRSYPKCKYNITIHWWRHYEQNGTVTNRTVCIWVGSWDAVVLLPSLIARFMGPTWGPPGADRTQVGPMMATWTLLSGLFCYQLYNNGSIVGEETFMRLWCNNSYNNYNTYNWRACGPNYNTQKDPLYLYPYNSQRIHGYHILLIF